MQTEQSQAGEAKLKVEVDEGPFWEQQAPTAAKDGELLSEAKYRFYMVEAVSIPKIIKGPTAQDTDQRVATPQIPVSTAVPASLRHLHRVAIIIQKWWRGYLSRKLYQLKVEVAYYTMKMDLYNAMAVRIQSRWRAHKVRKYCFNYFYYKQYLRAVSEANETIREILQEYAESQESEEKKAKLEREEKRREEDTRKTHYLLSTKQIPGIYNSPFRKEPDPWELRLQKAKPLVPRRRRVQQEHCPELTAWLACTSVRSFPRPDGLPPITTKPCQGPFRNINEVLEQRYKPLEPTLRAAQPVDELKRAREEFRRQERVRNISDKMFLPFSSHHKKENYMPSLLSSSKYNPGSCRKQDFRSENPRRWVCDKAEVDDAGGGGCASAEEDNEAPEAWAGFFSPLCPRLA
ncbi:Spermatogenesis-associated protein 17 [Fukomys damarensis]|uniref:Spermatogenesis-associated protein 17 n=1 Tax=Fukomys damarensis TaxID=885580 RepID=A0A091D4H3_FUKDA|nr:Spermatogenesis-associated protein 17 [Fukomys damarensis]